MHRHLITVSIFSRNQLLREGLQRLLQEGGFHASCYPDAELDERLVSLSDVPQHIILLETSSASAGVEIGSIVRARLGNVRVALLAGSCTPSEVRGAISIGIDAYISSATGHASLLLMLKLISLGEKVYTKAGYEEAIAIKGHSRYELRARSSLEKSLSLREHDILQCLAKGEQNKSVARTLCISEATVKIHIKSILRKLNVSNRTQAAIWLIHNSDSLGSHPAAPHHDAHASSRKACIGGGRV